MGALFLGFGYGTTTAACHALAVHCAPQHQIGIATSTYFVLLDLGIGVGPYALGSVVPMAGFSAVYVIAGVVSVAGIGLYYVMLAREHRFTRQQMDRVMTAKAIIAARREKFLEKYTENMQNIKQQTVVQAENKAQEKISFDEEVPTELKEEIRKENYIKPCKQDVVEYAAKMISLFRKGCPSPAYNGESTIQEFVKAMEEL